MWNRCDWTQLKCAVHKQKTKIKVEKLRKIRRTFERCVMFTWWICLVRSFCCCDIHCKNRKKTRFCQIFPLFWNEYALWPIRIILRWKFLIGTSHSYEVVFFSKSTLIEICIPKSLRPKKKSNEFDLENQSMKSREKNIFFLQIFDQNRFFLLKKLNPANNSELILSYK